MKKTRYSILLSLIVALLVMMPGSAQTQASPRGVLANDTGTLGLLITINRMELTPMQMRQIHDSLTGILSERDALTVEREAFEQEMLRFTGTADELDLLLAAFRRQMEDQAGVLRQRLQGSIEEIKGILTISQGEILRNSFMQKPGMRMRERQGRMRTQGEDLPPQLHERAMQRPGERLGDETAGPMAEQIREFLAAHPEIRDKMLRWLRDGNGREPMTQRFASEGQRGRTFGVDRHGPAGRPADELLTKLQQIVDILAVKLQQIE